MNDQWSLTKHWKESLQVFHSSAMSIYLGNKNVQTNVQHIAEHYSCQVSPAASVTVITHRWSLVDKWLAGHRHLKAPGQLNTQYYLQIGPVNYRRKWNWEFLKLLFPRDVTTLCRNNFYQALHLFGLNCTHGGNNGKLGTCVLYRLCWWWLSGKN